jgi:hypothetical protein
LNISLKESIVRNFGCQLPVGPFKYGNTTWLIGTSVWRNVSNSLLQSFQLIQISFYSTVKTRIWYQKFIFNWLIISQYAFITFSLLVICLLFCSIHALREFNCKNKKYNNFWPNQQSNDEIDENSFDHLLCWRSFSATHHHSQTPHKFYGAFNVLQHVSYAWNLPLAVLSPLQKHIHVSPGQMQFVITFMFEQTFIR